MSVARDRPRRCYNVWTEWRPLPYGFLLPDWHGAKYLLSTNRYEYKCANKPIGGNPCYQPLQRGVGVAQLVRWFYNPLTKRCHTFSFGGFQVVKSYVIQKQYFRVMKTISWPTVIVKTLVAPWTLVNVGNLYQLPILNKRILLFSYQLSFLAVPQQTVAQLILCATR